MGCNCESYLCLDAKFNPCSLGAELALASTETGTWSAEIEFNGVWTDLNFGVVNGQNIVIPVQFLNEQYVHKARFFNGEGELVNDTCYTLNARATQNAGIYAPIPPDQLAQILHDIAELQEDIVVIDEEISDIQTDVSTLQSDVITIQDDLVDHEFDVTVAITGTTLSDSRLLNRSLSTISMGGQDYNVTFWDKPLGSVTITSKNDPDGNPWIMFVSGQIVTLTLDL